MSVLQTPQIHIRRTACSCLQTQRQQIQGLPPHAADPGPKIGPRALLGPIFFWIVWVARGASLTNLGHFTKFGVGPNFQLFLERFSFITHLPPDHWGANPCKKHAGDLQEQQKSSPGTKNQNPRENFAHNGTFWGQLLCCNPTILGEQP